ncbi:MAG: FtsX-like permease family protein, partial [Bacteroidota bacterium]|nr:FtsX-like permease family protein [Bacteroidota bacterium]
VSAIGQKLKMNNAEVRVIGVLQEEGQDILNLSLDNDIIVSNAFINKTMGRETFGSPLIMAKVKEGQSMDEAKAELAFLMRSVRYQNIQSKDDFAINETSLLANAFTKVFEVVNQAGLFIGIFSILVGGIGILNIMLVSVRERRVYIGIKKALGAKRYIIMLEFLIEAVMLCLIGGGLGMIASYGFLHIANLVIAQSGASIVLSLSQQNVVLGLGLSTAIGLLAGAIPAYLGASLDPVKAIRKI